MMWSGIGLIYLDAQSLANASLTNTVDSVSLIVALYDSDFFYLFTWTSSSSSVSLNSSSAPNLSIEFSSSLLNGVLLLQLKVNWNIWTNSRQMNKTSRLTQSEYLHKVKTCNFIESNNEIIVHRENPIHVKQSVANTVVH